MTEAQEIIQPPQEPAKEIDLPLAKVALGFLIMNILFFIISSGNTVNSTLHTQMNNFPIHSGIATTMVKKKVKKERTNLEKFTDRYEGRSALIAKGLLVVMVLYFSVALALINYKIEKRYLEHLKVSFALMIVAPWFSKVFLAFVVILSLFFLERKFYKQNDFPSLAKASVLLFLFFVTLVFYRISIFYITMLTL